MSHPLHLLRLIHVHLCFSLFPRATPFTPVHLFSARCSPSKRHFKFFTRHLSFNVVDVASGVFQPHRGVHVFFSVRQPRKRQQHRRTRQMVVHRLGWAKFKRRTHRRQILGQHLLGRHHHDHRRLRRFRYVFNGVNQC
jgi:hypothetical protein